MAQTIIDIFKATVGKFPHQPALHYKEHKQWRSLSWEAYWQEVMTFAKGLIKLGLQAHDALGIIASNCHQWVIADLAAIAAGGVPVGIYPSASGEQSSYILEHCCASVLVLENSAQLSKVYEKIITLPKIRAIILINGTSSLDKVYSWQQITTFGKSTSTLLLEERLNGQQPEDLATLVYTSGTTAHPKGVMLSHTNLNWAARTLAEESLALSNEDVFLSYLPLSHIAEQIITIHAAIYSGYHIYFAESLEHLAQNLREVRPTVFFGVPRVWEKIHSAMQEKSASLPEGLKKNLATWAKKVGLAYYSSATVSPTLLQRLRFALAHKLVFSKVQQALGLDRCRLQVTAAAPISRTTLDYFFSLGIPLFEVYGLSESSGPATISLPSAFKIGSVGRQIPGSVVKIAADGEILVKGPHVCLGYLHNPQETTALIDEQGFLHTGDLGFFAENGGGYLHINGRKKNLIITAGGENISTEMIESKFQGIAGVEHVVAVGDRQKYLALLLTLDPHAVINLAKRLGTPCRNAAELAIRPELTSYLKEEIERVNQGMAHVQTIKKFKVLPQNFGEDSGELTPTLKVKRNIVLHKYSSEIAQLFG